MIYFMIMPFILGFMIFLAYKLLSSIDELYANHGHQHIIIHDNIPNNITEENTDINLYDKVDLSSKNDEHLE